ncbi:hypothetical protein [Paenibacillus senegalensis]|uniref:hypothetical protein n=1 Tax=Paenibacillus senegalensis TaxID=1465766 RepID=UPI00028A3BB9|nr:hypothetical protein [Paenibacillus senegalensis]
MNYYFSVCSTYMYHNTYMDFILEHYTDLGLPYPFPEALSYIASPMLMGKEAILAFDEDDQLAGAFGYIHGTGERDYEDEQIIQIQSVYITKAHRRTGLFVQGLQFLLEHLAVQETAVEELRFWAPDRQDYRKLFSKFATRIVDNSAGSLSRIDEYRVSLDELKTYLDRFKKRPFF